MSGFKCVVIYFIKVITILCVLFSFRIENLLSPLLLVVKALGSQFMNHCSIINAVRFAFVHSLCFSNTFKCDKVLMLWRFPVKIGQLNIDITISMCLIRLNWIDVAYGTLRSFFDPNLWSRISNAIFKMNDIPSGIENSNNTSKSTIHMEMKKYIYNIFTWRIVWRNVLRLICNVDYWNECVCVCWQTNDGGRSKVTFRRVLYVKSLNRRT